MKLPLVRLRPSARPDMRVICDKIVTGSMIVAQVTTGGIQLDFEGGIFARQPSQPPTQAERVDYAKRAAGRAIRQYPTVARCVLRDANLDRDFDVLGWVDTETWNVTLLPDLSFDDTYPGYT